VSILTFHPSLDAGEPPTDEVRQCEPQRCRQPGWEGESPRGTRLCRAGYRRHQQQPPSVGPMPRMLNPNTPSR